MNTNDIRELTMDETDSVSGGNAFWGAVFGFAMDNVLGAYVKNAGDGYGKIIKDVADHINKDKK